MIRYLIIAVDGNPADLKFQAPKGFRAAIETLDRPAFLRMDPDAAFDLDARMQGVLGFEPAPAPEPAPPPPEYDGPDSHESLIDPFA